MGGDPATRLSQALASHYRLGGQRGAGGMATVYLAEDLKPDRKVALKVLRPELAAVIGKSPSTVVSNALDKYPYSISPDGKILAVEEYWNYRGIRFVPLDGSGPAVRVGDTTAALRAPQFSPNGRWLAVSGVFAGSALSHIYLLRGDGTGGAVQVNGATTGDRFPHWTRGGRELAFRRGTAVYAVDVDPATGEIGTEQRLFDGECAPDADFDVSPDGNRFLMVKAVPRPEAQPLLVITSFFDELVRKVGK